MDDQAHPSAGQLLLKSVAEELKLPLIQIARAAELHGLADSSGQESYSDIQVNADMALKLVDSYLLGLELNEKQTELELEAVSIAGILSDTAHTLCNFARQYDVNLELGSITPHGLAMAHATGLKAALFSLGYALIGSVTAHAGSRRVIFGMHRCGQGIVAGVYGDFQGLASAQLHQARSLYGRARQPFQAMPGGSAAGVFVADTILKAMTSRLRVSRHQKQAGLAAILQPSRQLTLVSVMAYILLIEPDICLARTYVQALEYAGHMVGTAVDAQTAIQAADSRMPDLIILELQLALHNGIEFLYELRSYAEWQTVPVIVQTTVPPMAVLMPTLQHRLGVCAYHYKPQTTLRQLLASVRDNVVVAA